MTGQPATQAVGSTTQYIAFISYRHNPADRKWAVWTQKLIETYTVPKKIRIKYGTGRRLGKVFRDDDELPTKSSLHDAIEHALDASRSLIVICSPLLPKSDYCAAEVQRFINQKKIDFITLLLTEGEPKDSFPRALRGLKSRQTLPDGSVVETPIEPLAADVRTIPGERRSLTEFRARFRILASLIGCEYDELVERERRRRRRQRALTAGVLTVLLVIFGGLLATLAVKNRQKREANARETTLRLVAASGQLAGNDPQTALMLARRAWLLNEQVHGDARAAVDRALRGAIERPAASWSAAPGDKRWFFGADMAPDGRGCIAAVSGIASALPRGEHLFTNMDEATRQALLPQLQPRLHIWQTEDRPPLIIPLTDVFVGVRFYSSTRFALAGFGEITLWDTTKPGAPTGRIAVPSSDGRILAQSSRSAKLVLSRGAGAVAVVDPSAPETPPLQLRFGQPWEEASSISHAAISPSGRWLALPDQPRPFRLLDLSSNPLQQTASAPESRRSASIVSLVFLDEQTVATVDAQSQLQTWKISGPEIEPISTRGLPIAGSPFGGHGASTDASGRWLCVPNTLSSDVNVIDLASEPLAARSLFSRSRFAIQSRFSADSRRLFVPGTSELALWRLDQNTPVNSLVIPTALGGGKPDRLNPDANSERVRSAIQLAGFESGGRMATDQAGKWIAVAPQSALSPRQHSIYVWRTDDLGRPPIHFGISGMNVPQMMAQPSRDSRINAMSIFSDKDVLAVLFGDDLYLFRITDPSRPADVVKMPPGLSNILFLNSDANQAPPTIAGSGEDGSIRLIVLSRSGMSAREIARHPKPARQLISTDGRGLLSADAGGELLWFADPSASANLSKLNLPAALVALGASRDGLLFAAALENGKVVLFEAGKSTFQATPVRTDAKHRVTFLQPSSDGQFLLIANDSGATTDQPVMTAQGVDALKTLETMQQASEQNAKLRIYDLRPGHFSDAPVALGDEWGGVTAGVALPNDGRIAVTTRDMKVQLLTPWTDDLARRAERSITRDLTADEWHRYAGDTLPFVRMPASISGN